MHSQNNEDPALHWGLDVFKEQQNQGNRTERGRKQNKVRSARSSRANLELLLLTRTSCLKSAVKTQTVHND